MAKLYTAAQLQELQRLAANNKPLKSALEKVLSGRTKDLGSAEKKLLQQAVNMSPKDFVSAVESRLGLGSKARSAADLPKAPAQTPAASATQAEAKAGPAETTPKDQKTKQPNPKRQTTRQRAAAAAKESAAQAEAKAGQAASRAKEKASKKASETASKAAKSAGKTAAKAGEATVKGASKAGSAFGLTKSAAKGLGKVAAPVAAVGEAVNVGNLLLNEDARQEARDYVAGMEDDNILMRAGKGFLSPSDTIYGAGSAFADAISSMEAGQQALYEAAAMRERLAPQRAANQAKGEARETALEGALSGVEMEALERAAVRDPQLLKEFGAIQSPEQARALYDSAFSESEPTAEDVVDQRLAAVDAEGPAAPAEPKATPKAEPKATPKAAPKAEAMSPAATGATEAALGAVEEATDEPEVDYTDEAVGLFKNTHGTEFDPNSKMDRGKLEKMKGMLAKQGGLGEMSANQFALQVYRNS